MKTNPIRFSRKVCLSASVSKACSWAVWAQELDCLISGGFIRVLGVAGSGRAGGKEPASASDEEEEEDSEEEDSEEDGEGPGVMDSDDESDDEMLDIEKKAQRLDEDRCSSMVLTPHSGIHLFDYFRPGLWRVSLRRRKAKGITATVTDYGCRARRELEAEAEGREMGAGDMQTNIQQEFEPGHSILPGADDEAGPLDLSAVLRRIKEVARVLDKFQDLREDGRSRSDYMEQVCQWPAG